MKIGYIRGVLNSRVYKTQLDYLNTIGVDKIFHEINSGNLQMNELINYARSGDHIFIYSINSLGKNIGSIIRFIVNAQEMKCTLFFKKEKFDSSSEIGKYTMNILRSLSEISDNKGLMDRTDAPNDKGRIPRELVDLRAYVKLVERNEMTVTDVCKKLNIGRTTYYRRVKQLKEMLENDDIIQGDYDT